MDWYINWIKVRRIFASFKLNSHTYCKNFCLPVLTIFLFSLLDLGAWLIIQGQNVHHKKYMALPQIFLFLGYSTKLFCFCCVAWQAYVCLDKYNSQPITTSIAYVPNEGKYPLAVTFCKRILYTNMTAVVSLDELNIEDLLQIEVAYKGHQGWSIIYQNGTVLDRAILPSRKFTTFSWSDDTFKLCLSLQLGAEQMKLSQLRIIYVYKYYVEIPCNLQIFVHSWGSFSAMKYELPVRDMLQIIQLKQETVESVSTSTSQCSVYDNNLLDECLEAKALQYVNNTLGCISGTLR